MRGPLHRMLGDTPSNEPFQSDRFTAFRGEGLAMVESTQDTGDIQITLSSEGLAPITVQLKNN